MNLTEFTNAAAKAIDSSHDIVLADGDHPVTIVWSIGSSVPETILVGTSDGDTFSLKVERLT